MSVDRDMIELLQQATPGALEKLYDKYAPMLLGVIRRIVGNDKMAEDVLQLSFIEIWENKKYYDASREPLFTWMFRIARNAALQFVRSHSTTNTNIPVYDNYVPENGASGAASKRTITNLKQQEKEALDLVYFRGYSFAEAAQRLKVSVNSVREMMVHAIKKLKETVAL